MSRILGDGEQAQRNAFVGIDRSFHFIHTLFLPELCILFVIGLCKSHASHFLLCFEWPPRFSVIFPRLS